MADRTLEQRIRLRLLMEDPEIEHEEEIGTVWPAVGHTWDVRPEFAARVAALEAQDSVQVRGVSAAWAGSGTWAAPAHHEDVHVADAPHLADLLGPHRGPCGLCGGPDARHRVLDAIHGRMSVGDDPAVIAADYDGYGLTEADVERIAREHRPDNEETDRG